MRFSAFGEAYAKLSEKLREPAPDDGSEADICD